jgi:uncharacterized protein YukE
MAGGLEYDPEVVREFAAVVADAASQVGQITEKVGATDAKAADFGKAWAGDQGARYEKYMAAIAADLGNLSKHLTEVSTQLNQGTDLVVQTETSGLTNIKAIDDQLGSGK